MTYSNGKIYKIVCNTTNDIYIGSTKEQYLSRRLQKHKSNYNDYKNGKKNQNYMTSFKILNNNNYEIQLIESYPCQNKYELHQRERYWIENMRCVNKLVPTRSRKEKYHSESPEFKKQRNDTRNEKERTKWYCDVCCIEMNKGSKYRHLKRKTHLDKV